MFRNFRLLVLAIYACCHVSLVTCDYPCLCTYALESEVHAAKDSSSKILGYLYEFDCKQLYNSAPNDNTWTAIAFEHKVGYIQKTKDHLIQNCPGNPDATDIVTDLTSTTATSSKSTHTQLAHVSTTTIPTTQSPTTTVPTTQAPTTTIPTTQYPTTTIPTTQSPTTTIPTTQAPTTAVPTTQAPTTAVPTTQATTTAAPTTTAPLTPPPTTARPSTAAPTTTLPSTPAPNAAVHSTQSTHSPKVTTAPYKCPMNAVMYAVLHGGHVHVEGDSCFEIVSQPMTWHDAKHHCNANGGHLAYITSQAEENSIMTFLYKEGFKQSVWIGLSDQGQEEHFTWSSGYPFTYQNWYPARYSTSSHNSEDCVALVPDIHVVFGIHTYGKWNDLQCGVFNPSLCRYDAHPIQPATTPAHGLLGILSNLVHSIMG